VKIHEIGVELEGSAVARFETGLKLKVVISAGQKIALNLPGRLFDLTATP
jgi:hypothetical protein